MHCEKKIVVSLFKLNLHIRCQEDYGIHFIEESQTEEFSDYFSLSLFKMLINFLKRQTKHHQQRYNI